MLDASRIRARATIDEAACAASQAGRQTNSKAGRQTARQAGRHTARQAFCSREEKRAHHTGQAVGQGGEFIMLVHMVPTSSLTHLNKRPSLPHHPAHVSIPYTHMAFALPPHV